MIDPSPSTTNTYWLVATGMEILQKSFPWFISNPVIKILVWSKREKQKHYKWITHIIRGNKCSKCSGYLLQSSG